MTGREARCDSLFSMIGTIRKHQNWLWGLVIAATIISFVVYFSPNQRNGGGGSLFGGPPGPDLGSVNGEKVTPAEMGAAERQATLFWRIRSGSWPETQEQQKQIRRLAEQNLVIQSLLKEYKITPTTAAAARVLRELLQIPPGQAIAQDKLNQWVQTELGRGGLGWTDLDNFARQQAGQEYLMALFGTSGELITPKEEEFFYRRENQPMAAEVVKFLTSNYVSAAAPSSADLQDHYAKHEAEYRVPERLVINYVPFFPSNYAARADAVLGTNLDERANQVYNQQGPDTFKDESGQVLSLTNALARIKSQLVLYAELGEARKDAIVFLNAFVQGHDDAHPYAVTDLEKLAKERNLPFKTTKPFDARTSTNELNLPPRALQALFSLHDYAPGDPEATNDPEKSALYIQSPLVSETAVYVAGLNKRIPSEVQPFAAVRDQVVKDYREFNATAAAKDAGEKFASAVQVGLAQGKPFDAICAAQGLKPITLPPFALTTTNVPPELDRATFSEVMQSIFPLPTGQSTRFLETADGGVVAYLKDRLPVDEAKMAAEMPMFLARMREQREVAAFSGWLNKQLQLRLVPAPEN